MTAGVLLVTARTQQKQRGAFWPWTLAPLVAGSLALIAHRRPRCCPYEVAVAVLPLVVREAGRSSGLAVLHGFHDPQDPWRRQHGRR